MITRLDDASARKIAAGQVVTELTSAIKELLENALDAGAHTVTIRLVNYGLDQIVVDDDGSGIALGPLVDTTTGALVAGASTPLLSGRATTKQQRDSGSQTSTQVQSSVESECSRLRSREFPFDVDQGTALTNRDDTSGSGDPSLGFRGEALHSLANMSEVTVETRSADTGRFTVRLSYNPAMHTSDLAVLHLREACGTTVTVRNLFRHLPVRRREFTKNCRKQLSKATNTVKQYAVSHPQVRLLMQHQETAASAVTTLVSLTGSGDATRSLTEAYGGLCISHMQHVDWSFSFGTIQGLVSKVKGGGRLSNDHQVFALDGRLVDLPRLGKAIHDAFTRCLPNVSQRLHVAFFLQLQTNASLSYDVNLTPNKRKVIFAREDSISDEVHQCALREFGLASQSIELSQDERIAQTRAANVRASEMTKLTRTPVSATSFTQFTFKRERHESKGGANATGVRGGTDNSATAVPALLELPKLGAILYRKDGDDSNSDEASASTGCLLHSTSSSSSSRSSLAKADDEEWFERGNTAEGGGLADRATQKLSVFGAALSCGCGLPEGSVVEDPMMDSERMIVTRLSDDDTRQRSDSTCHRCPFPALRDLFHEPSDMEATGEARVTGTSPPSSGTKRDRHSSRILGAQTESDLCLYFNKNSFKEMRVIGQFNHGFIIAALPNGDVFVVDQHASDEKYNYERLVRTYEATPQPLVLPVTVAMDAHEVDVAVEHRLELQKHGFKVDRGNDDTKLLVYSLPVLPYDVVSAADVQELIQQLVQYNAIHKPLRAVWHSMATKACRSSVMIGTPLTTRRMEQIVSRLSELDQPWNCPHGRPTLRLLRNISDFRRADPKETS